jgi:hypothetical protein
MPWKKLIRLAVCAGLLYGLAACSEKVEIRPKGEMVIGAGVETRK